MPTLAVVSAPVVSLNVVAPEAVPSLTKTTFAAVAESTLLPLIVRRRSDVADLGQDVLILLVGRAHLRGVQSSVGGLGGECHGAVEEVGNLRQGAVGGLQQADAGGCILRRLREGCDVGVEAVGEREACGVVGSAVDARTGGELRECVLQTILRLIQIGLRVDRCDVIQYTQGHGKGSCITRFELPRCLSRVLIQNGWVWFTLR